MKKLAMSALVFVSLFAVGCAHTNKECRGPAESNCTGAQCDMKDKKDCCKKSGEGAQCDMKKKNQGT